MPTTTPETDADPPATRQNPKAAIVRALVMDPDRLLAPDQRRWLAANFRAACAQACQRAAFTLRGEARLRIVADSASADLHRAHMDDPTPTDVLTFDLREGGAGPLDVDIAANIDQARRASPAGAPVERELLLYGLHGLLHCLGHNDHTPAGARRMHAMEDAVLTAVGVGPVYRPTGGAR